jgi:hypothetical protein
MSSWRPDVSLINSRVDICDETLPLVLPAGCDICLYLTIDAHAVRRMQRGLVGLWPDILKVNPEEEAEPRLNLPGLVPGASVEAGQACPDSPRQRLSHPLSYLTTSFDWQERAHPSLHALNLRSRYANYLHVTNASKALAGVALEYHLFA